jgi:transaldolase/glucose-6-phosphate isomerase
VLYVDELIGPNTVNTIPPATVDAFRDHGTIDATALMTDVDAAERHFEALAALGIDVDAITEELQVEGVASFADAFNGLLATIEQQQGES